jgi:hypothetical protein
VGALAPLQIPGAETALTGENFQEQIVNFWDQPLGVEPEAEPGAEDDSLIERKGWVLQRKDFIPLIAESAIARIQSGRFNPLSLLDAISATLSERAVQVWLADPAAANLMAEQGWDGRLQPEPNADYLALVDTNMGYNKVNPVLQSKMEYTVNWPNGPTAPAQATAAVTYRHPLNVVDESCSPKTDYKQIASYAGMIERCYFGYLRLYVPRGSKLISLEGVDADSISSQLGERGTQVFAGYFSVKPGEEHTVTFIYTLPQAITPQNYQLVVQRQAGTPPLPLAIEVGDMSLEATLVDGRMVWPPVAGESMVTAAQ